MSASLPSLAFAGLGLMGVPMCRRLLAAGYPLAVWNRSPGKRELLAAEGAKAVEVPAELAADAEILMLCLADPAYALLPRQQQGRRLAGIQKPAGQATTTVAVA
ncbi:MAG: NAD(P)-binding domain-containing protein, partial [Pseudomonas aeruginosa]|nr:NAD(P)-binding domain-containing protein [Pseudomonas aeruginosa]